VIGFPSMPRADRRKWAATQDLTGVAELTAAWLEGTIASHPGDAPNSGRNAITTRPLTATLTACNRGGYLTTAWQQGADPWTDSRNQCWHKRAAIEGYVKDPDLLRQLVTEAEQTGLEILLTDSLDTNDRALAVTLLDEEPHTHYGAYATPFELRATWTVVGEHAMNDLITATRVSLTTKTWGADAAHDLWRFLDQFFGNTDHPYTPGPAATPAATTTKRGPSRAGRSLMSLIGKTWVHGSASTLDDELERAAGALNTKRWPEYVTGAERLRSLPDFQPGLLNEFTETYQAMLWLRAVAQAAHREGHHDLGNKITEVEEALATGVQLLREAAMATTADPAAATQQ
jgi:uncharacterized protein DUF6919